MSLEPEGWFEPWTCEWQFMQLRPNRNRDGAPEAVPVASFAMLGCPDCEWQLWQSSGARWVSIPGWLEPCGAWHSPQSSATGSCSQR